MAMEVADVTVMVEVVIADIMVVEVTAVDMEAEVAHLLLTAEHPDVITDHALVLTVLVSTNIKKISTFFFIFNIFSPFHRSILKIEARREWRNLLSFSLKKLKNLHPRNFFSVFHGITISQKKEKLPSPLLLFRPLYLCSLLKKYITEVHMTKN